MILNKKKILNVKYKSKSNQRQLLDKQFTIHDPHKFRITVKEDSFYFSKSPQESFYYISSANQSNKANISVGKTTKLKQKDGSDIYFTLSEDFLYSVNYSYPVCIAIALLFNIIILGAVQLGVLFLGK